MASRLVSPAGGLVYHWRAWRYRRSLWRSFVEPLASWLTEWAPPERALLLVGPSAGYCLPAAFFERFERITAIEPDPLARWLFARRFSSVAGRVTWKRTDPFRSSSAVAHLGREMPDHAVLFANVLGQLETLYPARLWSSGFPALLDRRSWASIHDRWSCTLPLASGRVSEVFPPTVTDAELLERFFPGRLPTTVEVTEHGTAGLFPGQPRRFLAWQIVPGRFHLIELVRSGDDGPDNREEVT